MRIGHSGIAALELALAAPILILLAVGAYDLGNDIQTSLRLERAVRAGAQYAAADTSDLGAVQRVVISAWPALTERDVPLPTVSCECAGVVVACTATCGTLGPARIVTVTASRSLSPLLLRSRDHGSGTAVVRLR